MTESIPSSATVESGSYLRRSVVASVFTTRAASRAVRSETAVEQQTVRSETAVEQQTMWVVKQRIQIYSLILPNT
jgi:hypothetical protein